MADAVVKMTVANPAKIVSATSVNAAVETAEGHIEGEIPAANIAAGAVTEAKLAAGAVTTAKLGDGAVTAAKLAAGLAGVQVLAVTMATATGVQTLSTSWANVTGLSLTVTLATGQRVLLWASVMVGGNSIGLRLTRGGAALASPTSSGSKTATMASFGQSSAGIKAATLPLSYLDAPAAGTHTYTVQGVVKLDDGYINRSRYEEDNSTFMRGVSTLMAVKLGPEVA